MLFHFRKDRYNLAKIEYIPYLLHSSNPGANTIVSNPTFVPRFLTPGTNLVGGEVDGLESLSSGEYIVERDINIRPGGKLILQSGVTLHFPPAVGMMVAGALDAHGKRPSDILFTRVIVEPWLMVELLHLSIPNSYRPHCTEILRYTVVFCHISCNDDVAAMHMHMLNFHCPFE